MPFNIFFFRACVSFSPLPILGCILSIVRHCRKLITRNTSGIICVLYFSSFFFFFHGLLVRQNTQGRAAFFFEPDKGQNQKVHMRNGEKKKKKSIASSYVKCSTKRANSYQNNFTHLHLAPGDTNNTFLPF